MSVSSIAENCNELSETQRVTLLLHMMEHMAFPDAKFTRDVKIKTIVFANDVMGLEASVSLLEKLLKNWKDQRKAKVAVYDFEGGQRRSKNQAHAVVESGICKDNRKICVNFP